VAATQGSYGLTLLRPFRIVTEAAPVGGLIVCVWDNGRCRLARDALVRAQTGLPVSGHAPFIFAVMAVR
jgi:hypothetical protein